LGTCTCDDWQQRGGPCKHLLAAVLTQWPARLETYLAKARTVVPPAVAAPAVPEAVVRAAVQSTLSHVLTAVMAAVEEQSATIAAAVLAELTKEASTQ
jgi:hypothetical protein